MRIVSWSFWPAVFAMHLVATGCGSHEYKASQEITVPAGGVIFYKGKPLDFYRVLFVPEGKRPAAATTDSNGHFVLGTNDVGDGAVAGKHLVAVQYVGPPVEVEPGKETESPVPPAKVAVPAKFSSTETSGIVIEIPQEGDGNMMITLE